MRNRREEKELRAEGNSTRAALVGLTLILAPVVIGVATAGLFDPAHGMQGGRSLRPPPRVGC
jgi:hypothetical protein